MRRRSPRPRGARWCFRPGLLAPSLKSGLVFLQGIVGAFPKGDSGGHIALTLSDGKSPRE